MPSIEFLISSNLFLIYSALIFIFTFCTFPYSHILNMLSLFSVSYILKTCNFWMLNSAVHYSCCLFRNGLLLHVLWVSWCFIVNSWSMELSLREFFEEDCKYIFPQKIYFSFLFFGFLKPLETGEQLKNSLLEDDNYSENLDCIPTWRPEDSSNFPQGYFSLYPKPRVKHARFHAVSFEAVSFRVFTSLFCFNSTFYQRIELYEGISDLTVPGSQFCLLHHTPSHGC